MGPGSEIKIPGCQATEGAAAKEVFDTRSNALYGMQMLFCGSPYIVCRFGLQYPDVPGGNISFYRAAVLLELDIGPGRAVGGFFEAQDGDGLPVLQVAGYPGAHTGIGADIQAVGCDFCLLFPAWAVFLQQAAGNISLISAPIHGAFDIFPVCAGLVPGRADYGYRGIGA